VETLTCRTVEPTTSTVPTSRTSRRRAGQGHGLTSTGIGVRVTLDAVDAAAEGADELLDAVELHLAEPTDGHVAAGEHELAPAVGWGPAEGALEQLLAELPLAEVVELGRVAVLEPAVVLAERHADAALEQVADGVVEEAEEVGELDEVGSRSSGPGGGSGPVGGEEPGAGSAPPRR
jgi:hypothetical protein